MNAGLRTIEAARRIETAFCDVWMSDFEEAEGKRNLQFLEREAFDIGEFEYIMRNARVGRYNHFDTALVARVLRKHCPKAVIQVARENSVALYITGEGTEKLVRLKAELHADSVREVTPPGVYRVFWG